MAIEPFAPKDFRVFDLRGFADRIAAIRVQVRPKLEGLGAALAPDVAQLTGTEIHAHVAKHARRTVNPPEDTWVAFGPVNLAWFRNEHDDTPAAGLDELDPAGWARLGEELTRTRDGQLVLGGRVGAAEAARWSGPDSARAARETFGALRDCFRLQ
jgi:hypothetical protein